MTTSSVGTASNAIFLIGALFPTFIPEKLTRTAFVAMNTMGFFYLDWQISFTIKSGKDARIAYEVKSWPTWVLTAMTTCRAVSDIFLMVAGFTASLALWAKRAHVATAIYAITRPWSISFLIIGVALDVSRYYAHRKLSDSLDVLWKDPDVSTRAHDILLALRDYAKGRPLPEIPLRDLQLASRMRTCMDKYTLETLENRILSTEPFDSTKLLEGVCKNIVTQQIAERHNLGLRAFGYVCLFLSGANPNTIVQPITYFAASLLYTANSAYKKWHEYRQRQLLKS